jgi:TolB protein
MRADGSNQVRVTSSPQVDTFPAWSPDGNKIAFQSNENGNFEIFTVYPDGSERKRLTTGLVDNKYPAWSPDGSKIVFYSKRDCNNDNGEIYIMNADGSGQVRVTRSECTDSGLADWR